MAPGPQPMLFSLASRDQRLLKAMTRRKGTEQAMRARVVLACAEPGSTNAGVARRLGVSLPMVRTWRKRFALRGLEGLRDADRPSTPPEAANRETERLVTISVNRQLKGMILWPTHTVAHKSVGEVHGMVGLFLNPPDRALVVMVGKASRSSVHKEVSSMKLDQDRLPHDSARLLADLNLKAGSMAGSGKAQNRASDFRAFLDRVEISVPTDLDVHVVLDNASMLKTRLVRECLVKRPRWQLHQTTNSASWFRLVEGWFASVGDRWLPSETANSTDGLKSCIQAYIGDASADPKPFFWIRQTLFLEPDPKG